MKLNQSKLNKKLKGYHRHFRGRFLLLKDLTAEEYVLWDISFSLMADWDKTHDGYGTFSFTLSDISYFANCDPSTVSRRSKQLFKLGLWKKQDDGSISVGGFNILNQLAILTKELGIIDLQSYLANQNNNHAIVNTKHVQIQDDAPKEIYPITLQTHANMHDDDPKEPLVSFKGQSNVSIKKVIIISRVRSNEEYQKMFEKSGNKGMTPQDMKDIEESIGDYCEVVTEENEQCLVDTYFGGNWNEYNKYVIYTEK